MSGLLQLMASILTAVLFLGCAQTATFRRWQPAQTDLAGCRLGIVTGRFSRGEAQRALDVARSRLAEAGVWFVDHAMLARAAPTPLLFENGTVDEAAVLEAGRNTDLDALLITTVQFLEADGTPYGQKSLRFGDPNLTAVVDYALLDVRSGKTLNRNAVRADFYQGELESFTEPQVLTRLAQQAGERLADVFTQHEKLVHVRLAKAKFGSTSAEFRRGVRAAKQGDWNQAQRHWQAALKADELQDATLYNLGLAHEASGDLQQARGLFETALAIRAKPDYRHALDRLHQDEAQLRLAELHDSRLTFGKGSVDQRISDSEPTPRFVRLPPP